MNMGMCNCDPLRIVPNTVMLCVRTIFLMNNNRDIRLYEYNDIIRKSGDGCVRR